MLSVAVNCARQAAKDNVKKFVHFSTAQVYDCSKVSRDGQAAASKSWVVRFMEDRCFVGTSLSQ